LKEICVWVIFLSQVLKRTRVSASYLGNPSTRSFLEKRRKRGQVKVTKVHSQAPKVRERQAKVRGGL